MSTDASCGRSICLVVCFRKRQKALQLRYRDTLLMVRHNTRYEYSGTMRNFFITLVPILCIIHCRANSSWGRACQKDGEKAKRKRIA